MKKILFSVLLVACCVFAGCDNTVAAKSDDTIYQTSTLQALIDGVYDGETTIAQLKSQGDFGIGTVNALDGELIILGDKSWHIRSDGKAYLLSDSDKTPFACVTKFEADKKYHILDVKSVPYSPSGVIDSQITFNEYDGIKIAIEHETSPNLPYAIKITGEFTLVKTRSVPKQKRPYPPLTEVTKHQPVFELKNVRGTMVGYKLPAYLKGVNVPGYHLHFITEDRTAGGHVLDFRVKKATVEIDTCYELNLSLPKKGDFIKADLNKSARQIEAVEKETK